MDVEIVVVFQLYIRFEVGHLEVVIYPVDDEVGEPRVLSSGLEKLIEQLKTLLAEVVAKDFETH